MRLRGDTPSEGHVWRDHVLGPKRPSLAARGSNHLTQAHVDMNVDKRAYDTAAFSPFQEPESRKRRHVLMYAPYVALSPSANSRIDTSPAPSRRCTSAHRRAVR